MIWVYPDLESLSHAAAGLFVQRARQAVQDHGRFGVAVSGGRTPQRTYELLAQPPFRDQVPWAQAHVFWADERCVPPEDPRSNERMVRQALLNRVPIPPAQIHPIRCAQAPEKAAQEYETLLRALFTGQPPRFDLVLLGLGENGHTASLFPGTPVLDERERWAAEAYVTAQDLYRVTLTTPLINQAAAVAFLVSGAAKAQAVQQVLQGRSDPHHLPAQLIRPTSGDLHWLLDKESSASLNQRG